MFERLRALLASIDHHAKHAIEPVAVYNDDFHIRYPACPICHSDWLSSGIQHTVDLGACSRYRCAGDHIILEPLQRGVRRIKP